MPKEIEYTFAALDDEEWELLTYERMDELSKWFEEKYIKWLIWYEQQPHEEKRRFMSLTKD